MPKSRSKKKIKRKRVTFTLEAAEAREVLLMGDFNHWNPKKHPMKNNAEGLWSKTVLLPPGKYEYKFFVDGNWAHDPQNGLMRPNCFGSFNSVLIVSE